MTANEEHLHGDSTYMLGSRQLLRSAFRAAGAALGGTAGVVACQVAYVRLSFQLPPDATGPTSGTASAAALRSSGTRRNIIFLGDSLVTGVGCDAEAGEGPTLPRRVAELLSGRLGVDVGWLALGETGADVGTLTERLMPQVQSEACCPLPPGPPATCCAPDAGLLGRRLRAAARRASGWTRW